MVPKGMGRALEPSSRTFTASERDRGVPGTTLPSCPPPLPLQLVNRPENAVGWYHSHPGYGCWLSGIDVSTQVGRVGLGAGEDGGDGAEVPRLVYRCARAALKQGRGYEGRWRSHGTEAGYGCAPGYVARKATWQGAGQGPGGRQARLGPAGKPGFGVASTRGDEGRSQGAEGGRSY